MTTMSIFNILTNSKAKVFVKWFLPFYILAFLPSGASAQLKFGYFSYEQAFKAMPEQVIVQKQLSDLKAQYEAEAKRVEEEFNRKYEAFLEVQRELAPTILNKRQAELQELMAKNVEFKEEARRQYAEAEQQSYAPLRQRLGNVLRQIGSERGYAFILNTDANACPYIDPMMGEDISEAVMQALNEQNQAGGQ